MPTGCSWRQTQAIEIVILMAGTAPYDVSPAPIRPTLDFHTVRMAVVTLARIVTHRMTVHTPRMTEDRNDRFERSRGSDIVSRCRLGNSQSALRWTASHDGSSGDQAHQSKNGSEAEPNIAKSAFHNHASCPPFRLIECSENTFGREWNIP